MIRKTLSIVALLLLSGFLINGITMTQNLKRLHAGLESNLESVKTLNQVPSSIIDKNGELSKMLSTMDRADKGLDDAIGKTDQLLTLLSKVVDYKRRHAPPQRPDAEALLRLEAGHSVHQPKPPRSLTPI